MMTLNRNKFQTRGFTRNFVAQIFDSFLRDFDSSVERIILWIQKLMMFYIDVLCFVVLMMCDRWSCEGEKNLCCVNIVAIFFSLRNKRVKMLSVE